MKSLTLQIASHTGADSVVSEIWFGNDQVAEVSTRKDGKVVVELFAPPVGGAWNFEFDALQDILGKAKNNLH